jgi:hypothetical protein
MILKAYDAILERMKNHYEIATDDIASLTQTHETLKDILVVLQNDNQLPKAQRLGYVIRPIDLRSLGWRSHLKAVGEKAILTRWDNVIGKSGIPHI